MSHSSVRCLGPLYLELTALLQHSEASHECCRSEDDAEHNPVQNAVVAVFNRIVDSNNPGLEPAQVFVGRMLLVPPQVLSHAVIVPFAGSVPQGFHPCAGQTFS